MRWYVPVNPCSVAGDTNICVAASLCIRSTCPIEALHLGRTDVINKTRMVVYVQCAGGHIADARHAIHVFAGVQASIHRNGHVAQCAKVHPGAWWAPFNVPQLLVAGLRSSAGCHTGAETAPAYLGLDGCHRGGSYALSYIFSMYVHSMQSYSLEPSYN